MHRMTVHFNDGRTPVVLHAGNFDLRTAEPARDGAGLQRYSVITQEGEEIPIFLDPASIAAVIPAPSKTEKGFRVRPRDPTATTSPVSRSKRTPYRMATFCRAPEDRQDTPAHPPRRRPLWPPFGSASLIVWDPGLCYPGGRDSADP